MKTTANKPKRLYFFHPLQRHNNTATSKKWTRLIYALQETMREREREERERDREKYILDII